MERRRTLYAWVRARAVKPEHLTCTKPCRVANGFEKVWKRGWWASVSTPYGTFRSLGVVSTMAQSGIPVTSSTTLNGMYRFCPIPPSAREMPPPTSINGSYFARDRLMSSPSPVECAINAAPIYRTRIELPQLLCAGSYPPVKLLQLRHIRLVAVSIHSTTLPLWPKECHGDNASKDPANISAFAGSEPSEDTRLPCFREAQN
jgi:hypothetical protein